MLQLLFIAALTAAVVPSAPAPSAPAPSDPFAPLALYNGSWTVHAQHPFSGGSSPDTLVNHCTRGQAFFTCEQVLNGHSVALVVFTLSKDPGKFDVDNIRPNGYASSDTDLFIRGDHWTFITNSSAGHPHYRTENVFHGPNAIHFEQFETTDDGKTWTQTNQGDETRTRP